MRDRLRTVRGQLELIGVTLVAATVFAVVLATQRGFFEGLVREKYEAPPVEKLARGYHDWMTGGDVDPRALMELDAAYYRDRVQRTLAAGNRDQKLRAVAFARRARHRALRSPLNWGLRRARAVGDEQLADALVAVLDSR